MDENTENQNNENIQTQEIQSRHEEKMTEEKCRCRKEFWCIMAAAFLGGFLAVYFAADQIMYRQYRRAFMPQDRVFHRMIKDFDRFYENERRAFERDFKHNFNGFDDDLGKHFENKQPGRWFENKNKKSKENINPFWFPEELPEGIKIKTEIEDDEYKVIVDLKAFQGDESRINYNVSNRKLTVFGSSKIKDKNFSQDISFSHDFLLPDNADISKISRKKDGGRAVIEVPLRKK